MKKFEEICKKVLTEEDKGCIMSIEVEGRATTKQIEMVLLEK